MMRPKTMPKFILLFLTIMGISCKDQTETIKNESTLISVEHFQTIIDSIYNAHPASIGLLVHIESPKNGISWSSAVGYSSKDQKAKLNVEQPMLIASSIKTYISAAILRLQEDGKLLIGDSISKYLTTKTVALFEADGYDFNSIQIKHLLSHTSGIADYVNDDYLEFIDHNQKYRWTRDEQLKLATEVGSPLAKPQGLFRYADVNFLLCTEIIEQITSEPFYAAIRKLLRYDELNLSNTWFPTLEDRPEQTADFVHQYWHEKGYGPKKLDFAWDSYLHDISWDLYGGGGIATNIKELAQFSHHLFNHRIIKDRDVFNLLTTDVKTTDSVAKNYRLGIAEAAVKGLKSYGHGGFWGTMVFYIPKLDAAISVCVLERHDKMTVIRATYDALVTEFSSQLYPIEPTVSEKYELYKSKKSKATLILFPGGGATAKDTKAEFDILTAASANDISVIFMNGGSRLWLDKAGASMLMNDLEVIFDENNLDAKNVIIGGMSIGGNTALTLSDLLTKTKHKIAPKGVFVVDAPVDLYALYESSLKDIANPNFDEERLAEPRFIVSNFEEAFTKDSLMTNLQKVSPFIYKNNQTSVTSLKDGKLRFYTEPDSAWWQENRETDFESTNAFALQQIANNLKKQAWNRFELIETTNKGYRTNGDRHPHSWSIVEVQELVKWILE